MQLQKRIFFDKDGKHLAENCLQDNYLKNTSNVLKLVWRDLVEPLWNANEATGWQ